MTRVRRHVLLAVLASGGCGRETHVDPETVARARDAGPTTVLDSQTLELSPFIPSATTFFVVVRGDEPTARAIADMTVGGASADILRRFAHHYGFDVSGVRQITLFGLESGAFGVVAEGAVAEFAGRSVGTHAGVELREIGGVDELVGAAIPGGVVVGERAAVHAVLDVRGGAAASLRAAETYADSWTSVRGAEPVVLVHMDTGSLPSRIADAWGPMSKGKFLIGLGENDLRIAVHPDDGVDAEVAVRSLLETLGRKIAGESGTTIREIHHDPFEDLLVLLLDDFAQRLHAAERERSGSRLVLRVEGGLQASASSVGVLAMVLATLVPDSVHSGRKAAAAEARSELAGLFERAAVNRPCARASAGRAGPTPPMDVICSSGPNGWCDPSGGREPWQYDSELWNDPAWAALGFTMTDPHAYHYALEWSGTADSCRFTVQAFGDLDADGVYSTFTRAWRDDGEAAKLVTENELD